MRPDENHNNFIKFSFLQHVQQKVFPMLRESHWKTTLTVSDLQLFIANVCKCHLAYVGRHALNKLPSKPVVSENSCTAILMPLSGGPSTYHRHEENESRGCAGFIHFDGGGLVALRVLYCSMF